MHEVILFTKFEVKHIYPAVSSLPASVSFQSEVELLRGTYFIGRNRTRNLKATRAQFGA